MHPCLRLVPLWQAMMDAEQAYYGEAPVEGQYKQYEGVDAADGAYGHHQYAEAYPA